MNISISKIHGHLRFHPEPPGKKYGGKSSAFSAASFLFVLRPFSINKQKSMEGDRKVRLCEGIQTENEGTEEEPGGRKRGVTVGGREEKPIATSCGENILKNPRPSFPFPRTITVHYPARRLFHRRRSIFLESLS